MTSAPNDGGGQALAGPPRRVRVAILPGSRLRTHAELWRALEEAFPVGFVGDAGVAEADAAVVFPGAREVQPPGLPCLVLQGSDPTSRSPFIVEMARSERLDRGLHGQRLHDEAGTPPATVPVGRSARVLATVDGRPIWTELTGPGLDREVASPAPLELGEHEFLRDHLTAGRFWSLLPLVHFLKRIAGADSEQPRSLDACFMVDDPNPRLLSYGHVRFAELARDAQECG